MAWQKHAGLSSCRDPARTYCDKDLQGCLYKSGCNVELLAFQVAFARCCGGYNVTHKCAMHHVRRRRWRREAAPQAAAYYSGSVDLTEANNGRSDT